MANAEYSDEMRGALFAEEQKNEKAPVATGTVTISGVKLRVAMWPARVAGGTGAGAGKKYWPIKVEYRQGATEFLAAVRPEDVKVTGATGTVAGTATPEGSPAPTSVAIDDMPF